VEEIALSTAIDVAKLFFFVAGTTGKQARVII
jgi:hypothetical protein